MKAISTIILSVMLLTYTARADELLSLSAFLSKVRERNLEIKTEQVKAEGAQAKASGPSIPAPMIGLTQMKEENGNKANGFEISQTIPFPTKISGDYSARKYSAQSQEQTRFAQELVIFAKAKTLYFSFWATQEKLKLLTDRQKILKDHVKLSRSSARSDSFAGVHVLKIESDLDLIENEITESEQVLSEKQTELASFINEDPETFGVRVEEPPLSTAPKIEKSEASPQFQSLKLNLESLKSRELEAKSSWLPDFNIRYREQGATSMAGKYNEVMVGVTLPFVFFWEPNAVSKAAISERSQAQYELEKAKRDIVAEKINLQKKASSLRKQIDLLKDKIIPRAEKRVKLVHNLAPRDMETLQDHLETMNALPELKLKSLELRLSYEEAVAGLEKFISSKGEIHE